MYICLYVYMYIYIHTYILLHIYSHTYMFMHVHIYIYIYTYIYTHINMYTCIYTYLHIYFCIHTCIRYADAAVAAAKSSGVAKESLRSRFFPESSQLQDSTITTSKKGGGGVEGQQDETGGPSHFAGIRCDEKMRKGLVDSGVTGPSPVQSDGIPVDMYVCVHDLYTDSEYKMCIGIRVYMCAYIYIYLYGYVCIFICICVYIYKYAYIYTNIGV